MNEIEAGRFLTMAIMIDPKMPQPDEEGVMRRLWAGLLADVPAEAAGRALRAFYTGERYLVHREPISPADVIQWWNARRRPSDTERRGSDVRELPRPEFDAVRNRRGLDGAVAYLASQRALAAGADDSEAAEVARVEQVERRTVRSVPCPHCHVGVGVGCVVVGRGERRLRHPHPSRLVAAQQIPIGEAA